MTLEIVVKDLTFVLNLPVTEQAEPFWTRLGPWFPLKGRSIYIFCLILNWSGLLNLQIKLWISEGHESVVAVDVIPELICTLQNTILGDHF